MALPLPESDLRKLRADLRDHRARVSSTGDGDVLVVRAPGDRPDLVQDIERAVPYLDLEAPPDDVLLVGTSAVTRVDPDILDDKLRARTRRDRDLVEEVRPGLARAFDFTLVRGGERPDLLRLAVRVPKTYARDLDHDDVQALRDNLGPLSATPKGGEVDVVYLVGDQDFARMDAERFFGDLTGTATPEDVRSALVDRLTDRGFSVVRDLDDPDADLAGESPDRRVLVRFAEEVDADNVERFLMAAKRLEADLFVAVAPKADEGARRRAFGTCVEVVAPADVGDLPV